MSHSYERVIIIHLLVVIVIFKKMKQRFDQTVAITMQLVFTFAICILIPLGWEDQLVVVRQQGVTCLAPPRRSSGSDASRYYTQLGFSLALDKHFFKNKNMKPYPVKLEPLQKCECCVSIFLKQTSAYEHVTRTSFHFVLFQILLLKREKLLSQCETIKHSTMAASRKPGEQDWEEGLCFSFQVPSFPEVTD